MIYWQQSNFTKNTRFIKKKKLGISFQFLNRKHRAHACANTKYYMIYKIQSLKRPTFPFFRAFTERSQCPHRAFTSALRFARAHRAQSAHRAFTKRWPCAHRLFSVHLFSVPLLFIFIRNSKVKRSVFENSNNWKRKHVC